jgi:hypothetical protein
MNRFVVSTVALLLISSVSQAWVVIDDFSSYDAPIVTPAQPLSWGGGWQIDAARWDAQPATYAGHGDYLETGLAGVLGGSRHTVVNNRVDMTSLSVELDNGNFDIAAGSGTWGVATLTYDGNGAGLNLDATKGTKIEVEEVFADHYADGKDTVYAMTLIDGLGNSATVSKVFSVVVAPSTPVVHEFEFHSFTGIDLTDIDLITFTVNSSYAQDSSFSYIASDIPTPAAVGMIGLCGGMIALRRKR